MLTTARSLSLTCKSPANAALFYGDRKPAEHLGYLVQMPGIMRFDRIRQALHALVVARHTDSVRNQRGRSHTTNGLNHAARHRITSMSPLLQFARADMVACCGRFS